MAGLENSVSHPSLNIHEAATRLGVCASTLRTWGEKTGVAGTRTSSGKRVYTDVDLDVLETIKNLRTEDAGWQTIRKRIGRDMPGLTDTATHIGMGPLAEGAGEPASGLPGVVIPEGTGQVLVSKVVDVINAQTGLADRYARAGYQIGRLESEVKLLLDERERLGNELLESQHQIALLNSGEETLQSERSRLVRDLLDARSRIADLEKAPSTAWSRMVEFIKKYW